MVNAISAAPMPASKAPPGASCMNITMPKVSAKAENAPMIGHGLGSTR